MRNGGFWQDLSSALKEGECQEIKRKIGNKTVDANQSLWLEFNALLEISNETSVIDLNGEEYKRLLLVAIGETVQIESSVSVEDTFSELTSGQQPICLRSNFDSLCRAVEFILGHENEMLRIKTAELEGGLFANLDAPKSVVTSSIHDNSQCSGNNSKQLAGAMTRSLRCSACGGSTTKHCSQCAAAIALLQNQSQNHISAHSSRSCSSGGADGGMTKVPVSVGRLIRKEDVALIDGHNMNSNRILQHEQQCSGSVSAPATASSPSSPGVVSGSSKLRHRLQNARDEKHWIDANDII